MVTRGPSERVTFPNTEPPWGDRLRAGYTHRSVTSKSLRTRYFANGYIDSVRERRFDEAQWVDLVDCLRLLCEEWRDQERVDKDIAQDLFVLGDIIRGQAERLDGETAAQLLERATELNGLIQRVYDGRWPRGDDDRG